MPFPGGANDAESFWKLLIEGRDAVTDAPADRWNVERYYDPEPGIAGKTFAKRGGFLEQIDQFDPQFFGISPREALYVDPQHRLLLETAWEAIEDAGVVLNLKKAAMLPSLLAFRITITKGFRAPLSTTSVSHRTRPPGARTQSPRIEFPTV